MKKRLWLICLLILLIVSGCAHTNIGKIDISNGKTPDFLRIGKTTKEDVLSSIGEPLGYREQGNRTAMIYEYYTTYFVNFIFGAYLHEEGYSLNLVFESNTLASAEVKKEGWGFAADIDPQLAQMLLR